MRDNFETNASFDDQCGIFVELEDTFIEEHSLEEPYVVELSEVRSLLILFMLNLP